MKRSVQFIVWMTFTIYCFVLFKLLFLDMRVRLTAGGIAAHFEISNFIPFRSICNYIARAAQHSISKGTAVLNVIGNLVAFFPMGCYLPCLFKKMRKPLPIFLLIFGILVSVELLQPILCIGVFDIDDIILNISGAAAGFGIVHIPKIKDMLKRFYIYS